LFLFYVSFSFLGHLLLGSRSALALGLRCGTAADLSEFALAIGLSLPAWRVSTRGARRTRIICRNAVTALGLGRLVALRHAVIATGLAHKSAALNARNVRRLVLVRARSRLRKRKLDVLALNQILVL
jgi:hypothetical protein